jgi:hypothetical protein
MRARLILTIASALITLAACHKKPAADAASSRRLQVEAYDPPIPKAPVKGKLETMSHHPEDRPAAPQPASSDIPAAADSSAAPKG